jgi:hypothetical protein
MFFDKVGAWHNFATLTCWNILFGTPHRLTAIGPDVFDSLWLGLAEEGAQQLFGAIPVLDVGGQDHHHKDQPMVSTRICRLRPLTFLPAS